MANKHTNWKKDNKPPACTKNPLYNYIPANIRYQVLGQIKRDSIEELGYDLDSCPKRKVCFGKNCIGRPLPTFSKAAQPYIKKLAETQKIVNGELFISGCDLCPIAQDCSNPCLQILDSAKRNESKEPLIYYRETVENYEVVEEIYQASESNLTELGWKIPWDILTERRQVIVKAYLYEERDFRTIAEKYNLNNEAFVKYEFYSALNQLSEYGVMRKFIEEFENTLTEKQRNVIIKVYKENKTLRLAAKELGVSEQATQAMIQRIVKNNNIKWENFVRRSGTKLIYRVPNILK